MNNPHLQPILSIIIPDIKGIKMFGICGKVINNENPISSVFNYSL